MENFLSHYKDVTVSRGFEYHYHFSPPTSEKPTLLLVHGFPALSQHWYHQINYFMKKGFGLVVPDQLGYGGTDKPGEPEAYLHSLLTQDLVDIVDHEQVDNVIAIGHDWGSKTVSVIANLHADRFLAFGFLAVGYVPPNTTLTYEQIRDAWAEAVGYVTIGYWEFFSSPNANQIIMSHYESFVDVINLNYPSAWRFNMTPTGALQAFLESDSRTPRAPYTKPIQHIYDHAFKKFGFEGPLNFYRVATSDLDREDSKKVPIENYTIQRPVFFAGAAQDQICVPFTQEGPTREFCPQVTVEIFDASHWVALECPNELNSALDKWIDSVIG